MTLELRLRRLKFRAWHRGTREADYTIGCFFDRYAADWGEPEIAWFEALLDEEDHDVLGWAMAALPVPVRFDGAQMRAMQRLDFVQIPE